VQLGVGRAGAIVAVMEEEEEHVGEEDVVAAVVEAVGVDAENENRFSHQLDFG
jgi:hypothetical protein